MGWNSFSVLAPDLAAFGMERLTESDVAYLATVDPRGMPCLRPVTPIFVEGALYVFMEPTTSEGLDPYRGSAYALHCSVVAFDDGAGEFRVRGRARVISCAERRLLASRAAEDRSADRLVLFELLVHDASATEYASGRPVRTRWCRDDRRRDPLVTG